MILALARIVIYSFIVLATAITIINYDCTVITIVKYNRKTFIVQATGLDFVGLRHTKTKPKYES